MKGIVFKVLETHLERHFGEKMLDEILSDASLSTRGAYTAVGDYPHSDLIKMVSIVAERTDTPVPDLVRQFGFELFGALAGAHKDMLSQFVGCVDMLASIETVIHRDVRKLYQGAELPRFDVEARDGERYLRLVYQSTRPFADLAEGLIEGALVHYGVKEFATISREDRAPDGTHAVFELTIAGGNDLQPTDGDRASP